MNINTCMPVWVNFCPAGRFSYHLSKSSNIHPIKKRTELENKDVLKSGSFHFYEDADDIHTLLIEMTKCIFWTIYLEKPF